MTGSQDDETPPRSGGAELPEGTRVDLGDDLLNEKTLVLPRAEPRAEEAVPESVEERIRSADILFGEGLLEEAKRIYRQILLVDPHHLSARKKLDEIHAEELKQIFGEGNRHGRQIEDENAFARLDSEAIMRDLDRDLNLGVFSDGNAGEAMAAQLSLFSDRKGIDLFVRKLDADLADLPARNRMDVGIAFLEMGLYDVAVKQFQAATREPEWTVAATALMAYGLVLAGRHFEATLSLEPMITDAELAEEQKVEFVYLMGRAHEGLNRPKAASEWYQRAREIDPYYRDAGDRLRALAARGGGKNENDA